MKPNSVSSALVILALAWASQALFPAGAHGATLSEARVAALLKEAALGRAAADTGTPLIAYPSALVYVAGSVPTAISPISVGGPITSFSITPDITAATGLLFDTVTGVLSGNRLKPLAATDFRIVATGPWGSDTSVVRITVKDGKPLLSYEAAPSLAVGKAIEPLTPMIGGSAVAGYTPAVTGYTVVGTALPPGLILDSLTGVLSGTPSAAAPSTAYRIAVTGPGGSDTATVTLVVHARPFIAYPGPQKYLTASAIEPLLPVSTGGEVTSYTVFSGKLPKGFSLDPATGLLTGTSFAAVKGTTVGIIAEGPGGRDTAFLTLSVELAAVKTSNFLFAVNGQDNRTYPFILPAESVGRVTVTIADAWGNVVWTRTLTVAANNPSSRELVWDGRSTRGGKRVPAGIYVARVEVKR